MGEKGMRMFVEGMDYSNWVEDLEYYLMGLGLEEGKHDARCLGLFISCGGPKVKEVYLLNKSLPKAKDSNNKDVAEYRHARNIVDTKMKIKKNETYEAFQFRNITQRSGENFSSFVHRCEVGVSSCGFSNEDRERHIRDQVVFGTNSPIIREKALSENLVLAELAKKGLGIESSAQFGSTMMRVKEEPVFAVNGGNTSRGAKVWRSPSYPEERERSCYKCGGKFPHDHQGCPAAEYACVMDIIRISATSRAVIKETQDLLEPNEEVGGEREISVGDIVGIVVIVLGQTM